MIFQTKKHLKYRWLFHIIKLTLKYKFNSFLTYLWETSGYSKKEEFRPINVKYYNIFLITLSTFITGKRLWLYLYPEPVFSDLAENSSAGFLSTGSITSQPLTGQYFGNFWNEKPHYAKETKRDNQKIREREYPSWCLFPAAVTVGHCFVFLLRSVMTFMKVHA